MMPYQIKRERTTPLGDTVTSVVTLVGGEIAREDITVSGPAELLDHNRTHNIGRQWPARS